MPDPQPATKDTGHPATKGLLFSVAPLVFFVGIGVFRCWLETHVLTPESYFSYYVALHHVLWLATALGLVLLAVHLVTRAPLSRLLPLGWGGVVLLLPPLVAVVRGEPLALEYLGGSFFGLLKDSLTLLVNHPENSEMSLEILCILITGLGVGRYFAGTWRAGIVVAVAINVLLTLLGVLWLAPAPNALAVMQVPTNFARHAFFAVQHSQWLIFVILVLGWLGRLWGHRDRRDVWCGLAGLGLYGVAVCSFGFSGYSSAPFDSFAAALPAWAVGVFACLLRGRALEPRGKVLALILFGMQALVFVPLWAHLPWAMSARDVLPFNPF